MDIVITPLRRARHLLAVFGSIFALVVATLVPGLASAAQLTERSIALSSSSKSATNVTYNISFTASTAGAAAAFLVDFCSNSPLVSDTCTHDADFDASGAASTSSGVTAVTGTTDRIVVTKPIANSATVNVVVTGINNPSTAGPLYARIITFDTQGHATAYTAGATLSGSGAVDNGGAAMSITDTVGVSAAVQESLAFCVAGQAISANCGDAAAHPPTLKLGETQGTTVALSPLAVSTGLIYTQISTNAVNGAVISLQSNATNCGGLALAGDNNAHCYIAPAQTGGIAAGAAKFGVKTSAQSSNSGTLEAINGYNSSTYALNYTAGNTAGVTSTYGDQFLDTSGAPIDNGAMTLTFGASASNTTPAGNYSADLSMIATGTF